MIRAIYRWQVKPGHEDVFAQAWAQGTKVIRATVKGAHGSLLLQSCTDPSTFLAISRWDSFEDWWAFRQGEPPDPEAFRIVSTVSNLSLVEAFYEMRGLRIPQAPAAGEWTQVCPLFVTEALAA